MTHTGGKSKSKLSKAENTENNRPKLLALMSRSEVLDMYPLERPKSKNFDSKRSRTVSSLANNISRQNRYSVGVGVRRMSIVIERGGPILQRVSPFFRAVKSVIALLRIVALLRSRNSHLVKISLLKIMNLVQAPLNAGIMNDVGVCKALIELLNLDPLNHWQIVSLSLYGLRLLALSSECSLTITADSGFAPTIEGYLKSDRELSQKLSAEIIIRCFQQPIQNEEAIFHKPEMISLLFKCLSLPYMDVQLAVLRLVEDVTYHCPHTASICSSLEKFDINLLELLTDVLTSSMDEDDDTRYGVTVL
jgi:hypothetical protein